MISNDSNHLFDFEKDLCFFLTAEVMKQARLSAWKRVKSWRVFLSFLGFENGANKKKNAVPKCEKKGKHEPVSDFLGAA